MLLMRRRVLVWQSRTTVSRLTTLPSELATISLQPSSPSYAMVELLRLLNLRPMALLPPYLAPVAGPTIRAAMHLLALPLLRLRALERVHARSRLGSLLSDLTLAQGFINFWPRLWMALARPLLPTYYSASSTQTPATTPSRLLQMPLHPRTTSVCYLETILVLCR